MRNSLIQELLFYKFELGRNTAEATKNICWAKSEDRIDFSVATRWLKKFQSDCKNTEAKSEA